HAGQLDRQRRVPRRGGYRIAISILSSRKPELRFGLSRRRMRHPSSFSSFFLRLSTHSPASSFQFPFMHLRVPFQAFSFCSADVLGCPGSSGSLLFSPLETAP